MRGRRRGIGSYTLGDQYISPDRRMSQMLMEGSTRKGKPAHHYSDTLGRIAQQLAGGYLAGRDQKNQNVANQAFTKAEPDSYSMQPTMNDQQIMESDKVQNILRQNTDADRMKNPMIQRNMNAIGMEQKAFNQDEARLNSLDPNNFMTPDMYNTEVKTLNDAMGRATQNIENYGDEFNQTMGRLNSQEPTDDQRADAVGRELLGQRKASEVNTLNEKKPQLEYAMQNLRGLENNPYAQRLLQGLMMNQMDTNAASRLAETQRGYKDADVKSARDFTTSERLAGEKFKQGETTKSNQSAEKVATGKSAFGNEDKLRDEFNKGSGDFLKVRDAFGRIKASAKDPSPAGDLALIFNYMKVLDPGSTVREGEFATAQNSASIPDRIKAKYNQVMRGERLALAQRDDFVDRAESLYAQQENFYKGHEQRYRDLATAYQLNPDRVVQGLNQGFVEDAPPEIIEIPQTGDQEELDELRKWKAGQPK